MNEEERRKLLKSKKYKFMLAKAYFEKGNAVISYLKWLIAFYGITTYDFIYTILFAMAYVILSFVVGLIWYKKKLIVAEIEVGNQFNLFAKEVRSEIDAVLKKGGAGMNMNDFARRVTLIEGKKRSVSIAQVKEILRIAFQELNDYSDDVILKTIRRYGGFKKYK